MSVSSLGTLSPSRNYGAGVLGAKLAIPVGAVAATPANLESLIGSNPSGTDFALGDGQYDGLFSNKVDNGYFGDPDDPTAVVADGGVTYPNMDPGTNPNGGVEEFMIGLTGNTFANFTVQKYRCEGELAGRGAIRTSGTSGMLFRNMIFQYQHTTGHAARGTNVQTRWCTSKYNGYFAWAGGGTDNAYWNNDAFHCADTAQVAQGVNPRNNTSDQGICKHARGTRGSHHEGHYHDLDRDVGKGVWFDIDNYDYLIEDCLFENIIHMASHLEISHGGIVRRNVYRECGTGTSGTTDYGRSCILINCAGPALVEDNEVYGAVGVDKSQNGIFLQQNDRDSTPQGPDVWDALCGAIVRRNKVEGTFRISNIGVRCVYTKDLCHFVNDPADITIEDNDETGSPVKYWQNSSKTAAEWAALGYS